MLVASLSFGRGLRRVLIAFALALTLTAPASAQVGPEESAKKLKPAPGLQATLWAAEPMVTNPTTMDVDSRGRVWVTEGLNYRLYRSQGSGIGLIKEADRIKILEDTDGDGKADKMTVFADRIFPVPMGIAVEEKYGTDGKYQGCKVYVGNSPDLLVLEDTDGDDKADKRYPLLTGFGGVDSDHGVHGMVLGLDGRLYFTHGDGCCSVQPDKSQKVQNFNVVDASGRHVIGTNLATTLRVDRDGKNFEILADRQRNNYETCLNAFGNIFTSDNDDDGNRGSRVIWVMEGGTYGYRTPGSPRHWGEDVPGNVPKLVGTGNGSPCGIMVYEGSLLKGYEGALFEAEAGTRQINSFPVKRVGSAFRTDSGVLLASDDPWFRPVDMTAAPDGSLFVADWYDAGVGGHAFRDQTTGRIYRVAPEGTKPAPMPKADFSSVAGAIEALRSPVVAAQDAARRVLIARGSEAVASLRKLYQEGEPIHRARALWVLGAIEGDAAALAALNDRDPRIREQGIRMLGRDGSRVGEVTPKAGTTMPSPPAAKHLAALASLAGDPDAGVRRELILVFRDLPTSDVGPALKQLAQGWDGQDRWYLEALGLALEKREPEFIAGLFDGTLYGDLALEESGRVEPVAVPPYFPIDRNEAFLSVADALPPANALSKSIGLAWRLRRAEALSLLSRIMPALETIELRQAADDVLAQVRDPRATAALADLALVTSSTARRSQLISLLTRKLESGRADGPVRDKVAALIDESLKSPQGRIDGIRLASTLNDPRFIEPLRGWVSDAKAPEDVRMEAVEALGRLKGAGTREFLEKLITEAVRTKSSDPVAVAAVRTLPLLGVADAQLAGLLADTAVPAGLRREAVRTMARSEAGARRLIDIARSGNLPGDLKVEATTTLYANSNGGIREAAAQVLPPPSSSSGRPLPPLFMLVRRDGDAEKGREVFFRAGANGCATCHRVQGQGQWIGPDLSTIGTKYGKDELLRSILNPSAAIGYNFRTHVLALADGRTVNGLLVEESPDALVVKTSEGQRVRVRVSEIEERRTSDLSLMPEGLAQTLSDSEIIDLLTFLSTLKLPVSVVGVYNAAGPFDESEGMPTEVKSRVESTNPSVDGKPLKFARVVADAEGRARLEVAGNTAKEAGYVEVRIASPSDQEARLVLDTKADVKAWLNGKPLILKDSGDAAKTALVGVPKGNSTLILRVPGGGTDTSIVTTFVTVKPLEFR